MPTPKLPIKLLKWFCKPDYHKDIEGDLLELYERRKKTLGLKKAKWYLFKDVLLLFRPGIIRSFKTSQKFNHTGMLRHNFILTVRNFKRYKTSFLINLIGLSTGLASALLIYLWVDDELSIDKFYEKDSQLYQVMHNRLFPDGIRTWASTPLPLAETLTEEMPEVEHATAVNTAFNGHSSEGILSDGDNHIKVTGMFASKDFFHVFSDNLTQGYRDRVLVDRNSIVISERLAKKTFNTTEDIIGKTLEWSHALFEGTFQVSGVFRDLPSNATAQFDVLFNIEWVLETDRYAGQWNGGYAETYLILKKGAKVDQFNGKITDILRSKRSSNDNKSTLFVQQYSSKYLYGQYENGVQAGGRIAYVRLFSIIALFILIIACINFMNLSTAQASRKMKEIGVKKSIGVNRKTLVIQFLGESMLMAFLSLGIAIVLIILLLPQFNEITGKQLYLNFSVSNILIVVSIVLFTGLVSGSYPSFYLSGFNPVTILKGKRNTSLSEQWVRNGLVILQFTISVIFIVSFLIVNKQIEFIQTKNMGYYRDNVISFLREGRLNNNPEVFLSELKNIPGVVNASGIAGSILEARGNQGGYSWRGLESDKDYNFKAPRVSYEAIETLGMEILAGRSFSRDYNDNHSKIILNEFAVKMMELEDPIGKIIKYGEEDRQIIGVVKDFQYGSIYHKVEPLIFRFRNSGVARNILVKIQAGTERAAIEQIEDLYKKFHPRYPFEFSFLDDDHQALYESENRVAVLSKYFTAIAIIISCLGLFGLATFTAERRLKEIGIRKILGSSVFGIIRMLTGDFTKTIIIAIFISLPISYLIAKTWLEGFAYKIDLNGWYFIGAGLLVLFIAWFTVGIQTIKAARVNPVECLKDE